MSDLSNKILKILEQVKRLTTKDFICIGNEVIEANNYEYLDKHFNRYGLPSLNNLPKEIEGVLQNNDCLHDALKEEVIFDSEMEDDMYDNEKVLC